MGVVYLYHTPIPAFAQGQFFTAGEGSDARFTLWWMGFHSTFINSAASEMGRYVSINSGNVRVKAIFSTPARGYAATRWPR